MQKNKYSFYGIYIDNKIKNELINKGQGVLYNEYYDSFYNENGDEFTKINTVKYSGNNKQCKQWLIEELGYDNNIICIEESFL